LYGIAQYRACDPVYPFSDPVEPRNLGQTFVLLHVNLAAGFVWFACIGCFILMIPFPEINASLNATATVLLVAGDIAIYRDARVVHRYLITSAFCVIGIIPDRIRYPPHPDERDSHTLRRRWILAYLLLRDICDARDPCHVHPAACDADDVVGDQGGIPETPCVGKNHLPTVVLCFGDLMRNRFHSFYGCYSGMFLG
jgi:hypothetical protein